MDYLSLRNEILSKADCAEHIVTNDMPKDPDYAAKDKAIAQIVSAGRTKIVSKEVGDGAISLALGIPDGPVFIYRLKQLAATVLPADATIEQIIPVAVAQQAVASMEKVGLNVGLPGVRAGIDLFIGVLLTEDQATTIKALAEVPEIITPADVSIALRQTGV